MVAEFFILVTDIKKRDYWFLVKKILISGKRNTDFLVSGKRISAFLVKKFLLFWFSCKGFLYRMKFAI